MKSSEVAVHYGIAEKGKLYSLEGNYSEALRYYREALRMCAEAKGADIFFQHYSQCIAEALELSGAYDEVISYCQKIRDFLDGQPDQTSLIRKYYASLLEKEAIQHLHKSDSKEAIQLFRRAISLMGQDQLPLSTQLLNWTQRGYHMTPKQVTDSLVKHKYFIVRKDNVNPSVAIEIPMTALPF